MALGLGPGQSRRPPPPRNPYDALYRAIEDQHLIAEASGSGTNIDRSGALGRLVQHQRRTQGMSQTTLSRRAGVGRRFVSELENGKQSIQLGEALKVAGELGIRLLGILDPERTKLTHGQDSADNFADQESGKSN